ncbi:conserved Plasmodium protein, unknown function [Plasmodium gaboni]|uniref:Heptatricopeptide repeat-containing protein n=1 Tax=Plasmodium gaboni TaxID=647221 RepID=A0ABY1URQ7_9APIC|nr:conserved Plasmodium protein, unknown function [Plasmodium gaboni]
MYKRIFDRNEFCLFVYIKKRSLHIDGAQEIFHQKSNIKNEKNKFKNIYVSFSLNKYININSLDSNKFIRTPIHYQKYKELVDSIKCASNVRLQNIHLIRKIINSLEVYIINYLNNLNDYNNDINYNIEQQYNLLYDEDEQEITPNSIITILISLYKLRYRNINFLKLLEKYIYMNKEYFKISQIHLILYIYSYFNTINNIFINSILSIILKNKEYLTNDNILNIFTSLFYINCKNQKTIDILIDYIINNELNFHINIIIYILNNLKKLNYQKIHLIQYFYPQIVNKLYMLNDEKNVHYIDPFFLKKNISNVMQDNNIDVLKQDIYKHDSVKQRNDDININVQTYMSHYRYDNKNEYMNNYSYDDQNYKNNNYICNHNSVSGNIKEKKHTNNINNNSISSSNISSSSSSNNYKINQLNDIHLDSFYGSLHNEYIVENQCTHNYIYEYYNKNDIHDKKKRKIILLMDVIIYYKYFKEELLKVLYEYILKNLKTYDTQDIYYIISNIFNFHLYNYPYINLLNNKLLLALCYNYIPLHKNCHCVLFLSLKLLMQKYNYYNIFIDNILFHKIKTEILNIQERHFLNLLTQYKNSHIIKYLCDLSLIYCNLLVINDEENNDNFYVDIIDTLKNNHHCNIFDNQIYNDSIKKEKKHHIDKTSCQIKNNIQQKNKQKCIHHINNHIYTVKYNEQNKLLLFEPDILLDLFFFYVELKYYKGIFLFLKSIFLGITNFKDFDIFLFYKINNYLKNIKTTSHELDKYEHIHIYKKFNALQILQIYEYFKNCFSTYDDFINIKKTLQNEEEDDKNNIYHFYFRNEICNIIKNKHTHISNTNSHLNVLLENNSNSKRQNIQNIQIVNDIYNNEVTNKYIYTNSKINYISPNKSYQKYIVKKEKHEYDEQINFDYKKKEEMNIPNSLYNNISIKYEKMKLFDINNYIYNIINNIFIYAPVDLFALHIHYYNSSNIKFLLKNIIFKLAYLNVNYLALVISKIYKLICKEKENEYVVFLDFFFDYLLGQERNTDKFMYRLKNMDQEKINNIFNINTNEKRTLIDIIYNNRVHKNIHDEKKIKKRIAYILYKNNNIFNSVNNDIIINEEFLNTFFTYVVNKKKYNFMCSFYYMTNESLYLILNSLQIKKKNEKYIECIELITNIMIFRYIQYTYNEEEGRNYSNQKEEYYNVEKNLNSSNDNLYVIKDIKNLQLNLNLSFDELAKEKRKLQEIKKKKNYEHVQVNNTNVCKIEEKEKQKYILEDNYNNNIMKKINNERENLYNTNTNIENKNNCINISCDDKEVIDKNTFEDNNIMKRFIEIYYRIIKVRYFHELPINKHIFRELSINNEYLDNHKFLSLLFFIYKYKFDETKYIFMLQKRCFLYKELYYTHSNYRIISFLCKKLNIHIDDNIRTTPTKQTSYDYER